MLHRHSFLVQKVPIENLLLTLQVLEKLSKPLISIVAEYASFDPRFVNYIDSNYDETADKEMLEKAKASVIGYDFVMLFLSAVAKGCIATVAYILETKEIAPQSIINHDFEGAHPFNPCYPTKYQPTTPIFHALVHKQFGIALFLITHYPDQIKYTIDRFFHTKFGDPNIENALSLAVKTPGKLKTPFLASLLKLKIFNNKFPSPENCLDSLKSIVYFSDIPDTAKKLIIQLLMNIGNIKINDKKDGVFVLSEAEINKLRKILNDEPKESKQLTRR